MQALETILTRRSTRRFHDKKISDEIIHQLLECAMSAPSARNIQPWHFIVVQNKTTLEKLAEVSPHGAVCKHAAAAIIPCVDESLNKDDVPFWAEDLSAATQNILLAARALDLGGLWIGVYPHQERIETAKKFFNLPQNITPFCIIAVGYTDVKQEKLNRYRKDRVHVEKW